MWRSCSCGAAGCPITLSTGGRTCRCTPNWSASTDPRLAAKAAADVAWWHTFNDPALDRLIEIAYQQNLPLQIAGLRILEARAQLGIAIGQQYPTNPGAIASASPAGSTAHANGGDIDILAGRYQAGFDAAVGGRLLGQVSARRQGGAAPPTWRRSPTTTTRSSSLTAEVARTYALIRTFQVLIALARQNVAIQEDGQRIAESRFRNGATSELDVAQATNAARDHARVHPRAADQPAAGRRTRCARCSAADRLRARRCSAGPSAIPAPPAQVAISVPAEMLRRRPDIRGAELRAIAQCDRIGVAKTDLFPELHALRVDRARTSVNRAAPRRAVDAARASSTRARFIYSLGASCSGRS